MRRIGVLMSWSRRSGVNRPGSRHSWTGCSNWAGPTAATCGSTLAGLRAMRTAVAHSPPNWLACAGRHPGRFQRERGGVAAGEPQRADRVRECHRSGRRRLRREPGAAGRQRHRVHRVRIRPQREMARAAQRDRAHMTRAAVLRDPTLAAGIGQFAAIQSNASSYAARVEPDRPSRRRRDGARPRCIRPQAERRPGRDGSGRRSFMAIGSLR